MQKAEIKGKWALVTGASRGIGRQVSLGLAEYGCNIVVHSRETVGTDTLAAELLAKGVQVQQVAAELSDEAQVDAMLASVLASTPGIDIVYNNAAIVHGDRHLPTDSMAALDQCGSHQSLISRFQKSGT